MKLTDIPLSRVMAKARREGRKNQTRRTAKTKGLDLLGSCGSNLTGDSFLAGRDFVGNHVLLKCPYGEPGDRLRWLTTWATRKEWDHLKPSRLPKDANWSEHFWSFHDSDTKPEWCGRMRPGRFLPKFLRHLLPVDIITSVRVERLQDISEGDAEAEGVSVFCPFGICSGSGYLGSDHNCQCADMTPVQVYRALWESINGPGSWNANPWVWCIEFNREGGR